METTAQKIDKIIERYFKDHENTLFISRELDVSLDFVYKVIELKIAEKQTTITQINEALKILDENKFFNPTRPDYVGNILIKKRWELCKKINEEKNRMIEVNN